MLTNVEMLQDIEKRLLDLEAQTPIGLRESSGFTHSLFCVRSLIVSENLREEVTKVLLMPRQEEEVENECIGCG